MIHPLGASTRRGVPGSVAEQPQPAKNGPTWVTSCTRSGPFFAGWGCEREVPVFRFIASLEALATTRRDKAEHERQERRGHARATGRSRGRAAPLFLRARSSTHHLIGRHLHRLGLGGRDLDGDRNRLGDAAPIRHDQLEAERDRFLGSRRDERGFRGRRALERDARTSRLCPGKRQRISIRIDAPRAIERDRLPGEELTDDLDCSPSGYRSQVAP